MTLLDILDSSLNNTGRGYKGQQWFNERTQSLSASQKLDASRSMMRELMYETASRIEAGNTQAITHYLEATQYLPELAIHHAYMELLNWMNPNWSNFYDVKSEYKMILQQTNSYILKKTWFNHSQKFYTQMEENLKKMEEKPQEVTWAFSKSSLDSLFSEAWIKPKGVLYKFESQKLEPMVEEKQNLFTDVLSWIEPDKLKEFIRVYKEWIYADISKTYADLSKKAIKSEKEQTLNQDGLFRAGLYLGVASMLTAFNENHWKEVFSELNFVLPLTTPGLIALKKQMDFSRENDNHVREFVYSLDPKQKDEFKNMMAFYQIQKEKESLNEKLIQVTSSEASATSKMHRL